jgi:hypothetical protein
MDIVKMPLRLLIKMMFIRLMVIAMAADVMAQTQADMTPT